MMMLYRCVGVVMVGALVACASAGSAGGGSAAGRSGCALTGRDSAYLARGPVFRDCAVDEKARLTTTNAHPDFQPAPSDNGCLAAEVEFVVDTLGAPEVGSARVVRATTQPFGDAVVAMVPSLKYEPARLSGTRVRQIVVERRTAMLARFVVPAGSTPTRSGAQRPPNC
jgi:hypothetical protein